MLNFISYKQLVRDCVDWCKFLPKDFDAIVPIPRSGYLVAAVVGLHMNKPILTMEEVLGNKDKYPRSRKVIGEIKKVLILDDSINTGKTITKFKEFYNLDEKLIDASFGCLYYHSNSGKVKHMFKKVEAPRLFEWNFLNHGHTVNMAFDMDGAICTDPRVDDDGEKYIKEITNAKPLYIPAKPILAVVTCRLEKYRKESAEWLARHGVKYKHLIMMQYKTKAERIKAGKHAEFKALHYKQLNAGLFVESNKHQANKIRKITGKPVVCIDELL